MATLDFKRRLTAILSADAKDYSRLMGTDEITTIKTLKSFRQIMAELIYKHRGRVVDSPGDNLLAEFQSVVDAVQCAIDIQEALKAQNEKLSDDQKMEFRIGVNLGDVIFDEDRIYGDGVNIAARLEGLAEGGGICISGSAYEHVGNKIPMGCEYIGEHGVKNISKPVKVYKVWMDTAATECRIETNEKRRSIKLIASISVTAIILLAAIVIILWSYKPIPPLIRKKDTSSQKFEHPFHNKPSIAVLPFKNLSDDPAQEYFSDGITDDLITDLSKISGLLVVSRTAVSRYKGEAAEPQDLRRELGVRYLIEGSIQKVENRVRVNAQLIDTETGFHLWAERYDHDLNDIFALQDQLTGRIIDAFKLTLSKTEKTLLKKGGTNVPEAYDALLRARKSYVLWTPQSNKLTLSLQKKAIELDPKFVQAYTEFSYTHFQKWILEGSTRPETLENGLEMALKAVEIDPGFAPAHVMVGWMRLWSRQYAAVLGPMKHAIELDPNYSEGMARLSEALMFLGSPDEALRYSLMARERVFHEPYPYNFWLGEVYFYLNRHMDAVKELKRAIEAKPDFFPTRRFLAVVYVEMGLLKKAEEQVRKALKINPKLSINLLRRQLPFKNPSDLERQLVALQKAGLPE